MSTEKETASSEAKSRMVAGPVTIPFPDTFTYSNVSGLGTSLMDVHISFAEVMPNGSVVAKVGVVLPVEHAAQLTLNLFEQIALFEENFGAIRHPQWKAFFQRAQASTEEMMAEIKAQIEKPTDSEDKPE